MKTNKSLPFKRNIICCIAMLFCCAYGFGQSSGIILSEFNMPLTIEEGMLIEVTGTFKNEGSTTYNGTLGLHLRVKDTEESNYGIYYSSAIGNVGTYSLDPGEEGTFTTTIYAVPSLFNAISKDVVIILPKIGNESQPSTTQCIIKDVQVNFQH